MNNAPWLGSNSSAKEGSSSTMESIGVETTSPPRRAMRPLGGVASADAATMRIDSPA